MPSQRTPLRCRLFGHAINIGVVSMDGHQSYRSGRCVRCGLQAWQRRGYFGGDCGPWREGNGSAYGDDGAPVRVGKAGCL